MNRIPVWAKIRSSCAGIPVFLNSPMQDSLISYRWVSWPNGTRSGPSNLAVPRLLVQTCQCCLSMPLWSHNASSYMTMRAPICSLSWHTGQRTLILKIWQRSGAQRLESRFNTLHWRFHYLLRMHWVIRIGILALRPGSTITSSPDSSICV
jgi:hypothetical protein